MRKLARVVKPGHRGVGPRLAIEGLPAGQLEAARRAVGVLQGKVEFDLVRAEDVGQDVLRHNAVKLLGRTDELRQSFYAITIERRLSNPAVMALAESPRRNLLVRACAETVDGMRSPPVGYRSPRRWALVS